MLNRVNQPKHKPIDNINIAFPEIIPVFNDHSIYMFNNKSELIQIQFIFNAGSIYQQKPLQAVLTSKMLTEGTLKLSSKKIAASLDYYGARITLNCTKDNTTINIVFLRNNWERIMPLIHQILIESVFPENEFKTLVNVLKQAYLIDKEKVTTLSNNKFNEVIFGVNNFYGYTLMENDFAQITTKELKSFFKENYTASKLKLIISGHINDSQLKDITNIFKALGQLDKSKNNDVLFENMQQKTHFVEKYGALQNAIKVGFRCFNRNHPDDKMLRIINTVLGGYFGSRLMGNIREDKGYTYGIGSSVVSFKNTGYYVISTQVGTNVCEAALKEIEFEINKLQNELIPEKELSIVKNYMTGSILRSLDGSFNLVQILSILLNNNLTLEYFIDYLKVIKETQAKDLLLIAQKYLSFSEMHKVVAGKTY